MPDFDVFSLLEFRKRTAKSHGNKKNGNCKRKSRVQKSTYCTLRDLDAKLDVHGRHCMLSYLSSLPITVLRSLDTEANKLMIELTDYMMLLYLQGVILNMLLVQSLYNIIHLRYFIEIPFVNKGMDFIDLPNIFKDESVQSSIPNYFK